MSDRSLGFSVILFLIVFVFIPAIYLSSKALAPVHCRTIVFDSINTGSFLRIEDPVRMKGFEAGLVQSITRDKEKTLVKIETAQPLVIHRGYGIIAETKGFMGDRYLEINPGEQNAPIVNEKELLYGSFPLGPTEAVAFMGKLKTTVDSLVKITFVLKNGSVSSPSFTASFHSVTRSLDSIAASLSQVLKEIDRKIGKGADSLALALQKADILSRQLNSTVPEALSSLNSIIAKTEKLLIAVDTLVATSDRLVKKANGPEVAGLAATFNKLKIQIETVRNLLYEVRKKGVDLPIRLR